MNVIQQALRMLFSGAEKNIKQILRYQRIPNFVAIIIIFSLLVSGCSAPISDTDIIEILSINSGNLQINRNEYADLVISSNVKNTDKTVGIKCISSNVDIAAVINNKVFGLSDGVANITCYAGSVISNSIRATIIDKSLDVDNPEDNDNTDQTQQPPIEKPVDQKPTPPTDHPTPKPDPTPTPLPDPVTPIPTPTPDPPPSNGKLLIVNYIDVGQGDSILIQTPNGSNILIDAGTSSYQTKVANYLIARGITKIDVLIATHPHADHIGGMSYIIENFQIGSIYMPKATTTTKTYETLLTTIKSKGLLINTAKAGMSIDLDSSLSVKIIAPVSSTYSDLNQHSVVLKITYQNNSFLFMGDAGFTSEQEILNLGISLKADVLKVGHHGSSTSTSQSFLTAVAPKYAVISVGKNSYGHPTEEVINRLTDLGVNTFRTDIDGNIVISSDGKSIFVE
ncbi:MAG: hypothetical protein CVU96_00325 [Firmicutes bacterium HGW-Firmicutes-20]|nr:MAG: hypothetical protein CVU96_00325 [Firmicutes bacterium HGW-Firmicutes-20]PKM70235.1 MAG: hypothetical protein CVU94_00035 [Firmicutes bacterium HGW-Firmicutes-19]